MNRDAATVGAMAGRHGTGAGDARPRASGLSHLVLHLHPRIVPLKSLRWTHTFGLGGLSVVLVLILTLSGVLLLFAYEPASERAYDSVQALHDAVPLGGFIRNLHRAAADLVIVIVFLHLARVVFTGAYRGARSSNWILGLCLFALLITANFTGYLLPWDQTAYWAVTICTSMLDYVPLLGTPFQGLLRGGSEVGPRTLSTFYVLHIVFLPVALGFLVLFHFWLVRKAGGVVLPRAVGEPAERGPTVPVSPHLTTREGAAALVLLAGLCVLALTVDAPLAERANPGLSPNPAKAPWYFAGAQELLMHVHPWVAACIVPLAVAVFLVSLPYWGPASPYEGVWFQSATGRRMARASAVWGALLALCGILFDAGALGFPRGTGALAFVTTGLLPMALFGLVAVGIVVALRRRLRADVHETLHSVVAGLMAALVVLTIVGAAFRGPGMRLVWPGHAGRSVTAVDGSTAGER